MESSILNYLALAAAVFALLAGVSAVRRGRSGARSAATPIFAAVALLATAGAAASIALSNPALLAGAAAISMVLLAVGLRVHMHETEALGELASEQRVDLTSGLPNERLFYERLAAEHSRTKRTNQRYSIAVCAIDNYAALSDEDKVNGMKLLADSLSESIRNTDTLGRLSENQVAVLLVDTLTEGAVIGCDRAAERFFFQSCGHSDGVHVTRPLTMSVGIACFDDDTIDPRHVVDNAKLVLSRLKETQETGIRTYEPKQFARSAQQSQGSTKDSV
jgi:diguanylate cyclase (GGDEF)-like protein